MTEDKKWDGYPSLDKPCLIFNHFLRYLLSYDPENCISSAGIRVRQIINPAIRFFIPLTTPTKLIVERRAAVPKKCPTIFVSTHGFKEDAEDALLLANRQAYILIGSLSQIFKSFQGITAWAAGVVLVDRDDKRSRAAAREKLIRALNLGANIIIFPEGTWNKSPNLLMNKLFPGVYDIAKATGAPVSPLATMRVGKKVYGILEETFDITAYGREEGIAVLRDKLATLRWELMDKYAHARWADLPHGEEAARQWQSHIDSLMAEVKYYDYDVELHTKYVDKAIIEPEDAFRHLDSLIPSLENAFLFSKRNHQ